MKKTLGGALVALAVVIGIIATTSTTADAQWRRNGGYGGYNNQEAQQGYQYGVNTGASDGQRGQSYNPQRSHYYQNATYGYSSSYGNKNGYKEAYRDGFLRGYQEGYRRYGGYNRGRNNGRRFPFPW